MPLLDDAIRVFDNALRTVAANPKHKEDMGEFPSSPPLTSTQRQTASSLMRVNHCGEVCAQALYEGQALTTRNPVVKEHLHQAASEEAKHLQMCQSRLKELEANTSILDPLFYATSFGMGAIAGLLNPKLGLGFIEATEDEVCKHLNRHMDELSTEDVRTHAMLSSIQQDEARHQETATELGGAVFNRPLKSAMALLAQVMTRTTRYI